MLDIFVDADACPVKKEILRVAERHDLAVHMVSNQWMRVGDYRRLNRVTVPDGPDAADDWIEESIDAGDIAITADILLAERCLRKGAEVLGPTGKPFHEDNIGMAVAARGLMAHLRDTGDIQDHAPAFTKRDRSRFLEALENAIQTIRHQA